MWKKISIWTRALWIAMHMSSMNLRSWRADVVWTLIEYWISILAHVHLPCIQISKLNIALPWVHCRMTNIRRWHSNAMFTVYPHGKCTAHCTVQILWACWTDIGCMLSCSTNTARTNIELISNAQQEHPDFNWTWLWMCIFITHCNPVSTFGCWLRHTGKYARVLM